MFFYINIISKESPIFATNLATRVSHFVSHAQKHPYAVGAGLAVVATWCFFKLWLLGMLWQHQILPTWILLPLFYLAPKLLTCLSAAAVWMFTTRKKSETGT